VLLVEDDAAIAEAILYALRKEGMAAEHAPSLGAAGPQLAACDVVILDLGLPDGSGFSLLRDAQRLLTPPRVIVLTSRDEDVDCVAALEAGADDYVTKPFSPRVLVARVRAVVRRGPRNGAKGEHAVPSLGGLVIDLLRRDAAYGAATLTLTKIEFDLLAVLAGAPGRVLTREQLVEKVWGGEYALTPRTVDSHFKALRRKLALAGAPEGIIETVRAVGFRLRETT
jgi:two-component system catabolic regulation response regulator CreB